MPSVYIKETEYFDVGLRKFKRACEKAGILPEIRKREFYEKPTEMRKRKMAAAVKRAKKPIEDLDLLALVNAPLDNCLLKKPSPTILSKPCLIRIIL